MRRFWLVPASFLAASVASAQSDYSGLAIDLSGADAAIVAIGTAVLGVLGVLLVVKLVKRAAN